VKIKDKGKIKRILFITLSNIGDIILTTPILAVLKKEFPQANIDVISGPSGKEIFLGHPFVSVLVVYDKFSKLQSKRQLVKNLRNNKYDLICDLRNSLFPFLIGARYRTSLIRKWPSGLRHKRDEHILKLKEIGLDVTHAPFSFHIDAKDQTFVSETLSDMGIKKDFVVVSPGAKSHIKRWNRRGFALICDRLINEVNMDVIMVGGVQDKEIVSKITAHMKKKARDLTAKLTLRQLGALIRSSRLLITNDSAPLHVGSAVGARVLAIFGPTDPRKYGPTGKHDTVIRKKLKCAPCEVAQCKENHECMNLIDPNTVFDTAKKMLTDI